MFENLGWSALPSPLIILATLSILGIIALRGIKESTRLAVTLTLIEAAGLLIILVVAGWNGDIASAITTSARSIGSIEPLAIALGGFLAFYAFVGFEDMVNIAEEVKNPKQNVKKGMLAALGVASVLYILVAIAALSVLSSSELADSKAPLAAVFEAATGSSLPIITVIGLFAVTNGVLTQIITSSRILYGLAREGWLPKKFASISPKTHTPQFATYIAIGLIALGSLSLPLGVLAQITSFGLLIIFSVVQIAAFRLRQRKQIQLHYSIPVLGLFANMGVIAIQILSWLHLI